MGSEFSVLIDKTGNVFRLEGDSTLVRARLPEEIKNGSVYDFFPEEGHDLVARILDSVSKNTEGRISDIAVLTEAGNQRFFSPDRETGRCRPVVVPIR